MKTTLSLATASAFSLVAASALAAPIGVPNSSFEVDPTPETYPYVNINVSSWQKAAEPAYFQPAVGQPFGFTWAQTAGVFRDTNPYANADGIQAGYILSFPQVALFQDYYSTPGNDFDAAYEVGNSYQLTIGVFGKSSLAPGSTLALRLYYLDDANGNARVPISSTTVTYTSETFPSTPSLSLIDFTVDVPTVESTDAWAGKYIGIQLESTTPLEASTGGNWDFDNVRLTVVPEPGSAVLLGLGVAGFLAQRRRSRPQA